jgi:primosomal protein N'
MKDINNYQVTNNPSNCDMPLPQGFGKQEGWICPVCGRGVSPWVDFCPCQSDWKITYGTGTATNNEELNRLFELNNKRVDEMIAFENADLLEG